MKNKRKFVIADIHGAYKALMQCFDQADFDYQNDILICLGDVCDGWPEIDKVFDELLKLKKLIYILGNHDFWALSWAETGSKPDIWLTQGGQATIDCYSNGMPESHIEILKTAYDYYIDENRMFVHGGFYNDQELKDHDKETFLWDRSLFQAAMFNMSINREVKLTRFDEVYIGHSPTEIYNIKLPIKSCGIWMIDTGAGWSGVLSLMNIDTKEYYISDSVPNLYPDHRGRF